MQDIHTVRKLLEGGKNYQVDTLRDINLREFCTPFEGIPKKHPGDKNVLILLTNPFTDKKDFYEFSLESIINVEELETMTTEKGESLCKIRIWVKKGVPALKTVPFIVK